jgi:photosystem II stability/assembly factor-like uncharacterized protein
VYFNLKRVLAIVLWCSISPIVAAKSAPVQSVIAPLASKSLLLDIVSVNQQKLVAVGQYGHILLSNDGNNWQQAQVPIQSTLTAVYFIDEKHGWAVGHDAAILATVDGGMSWHIQQYLPETEKPLLDVAFRNPSEGVAIGAYGQFYRTIDGGKTWNFEFHSEFLHPDDVDYLEELKNEDEEAYLDERASILPHFNRVVADGRTLYLVGEIGLIAKSNDFGLNWQTLDEIYQGSFFDLVRTQHGNLLVAGLRGNVFRSLRNGTPWQKSDTKTTALINSIVMSDDDRLFLLGNGGVILESRDDGASYIERIQPDGKALIAGVWFNGKIVAVSDVGVKTIEMMK